MFYFAQYLLSSQYYSLLKILARLSLIKLISKRQICGIRVKGTERALGLAEARLKGNDSRSCVIRKSFSVLQSAFFLCFASDMGGNS
jgi:hypothetical protein